MVFAKSISRVYNNNKLLLIFIFLTSLIASWLFLVLLRNVGPSQQLVPGTDYLTFYEPVANNILQGKGVTIGGELGLRYPPGYPVILAIIFGLSHLLGIDKLGLIVVFNVLMAAGATCFLFLIVNSIFNKKIALISSFLWLSYPFWLWFLKNPNTEVPFILLLYSGVWLYLSAIKKERIGLIFLSGIILGLASLIRPIAFLLPFLLAISVFYLLKESARSQRFIAALIFLIGSIMAVLPWEGYVLAKTGQIIPLSGSGPTAIVDGLTFAVKPGAGGDQAVFSNDIMVLMERAKTENLTSLSEISRFLFQEFTKRPLALMKLIGWKMVRSWYATSQMWWETKILLLQLIYLIPGLFGIFYLVRKCKDKIREIIFLLSIVFYFWLMTVLALSILRYMVPAMGIVMIFSAIVVDILTIRLSENIRNEKNLYFKAFRWIYKRGNKKFTRKEMQDYLRVDNCELEQLLIYFKPAKISDRLIDSDANGNLFLTSKGMPEALKYLRKRWWEKNWMQLIMLLGAIVGIIGFIIGLIKLR